MTPQPAQAPRRTQRERVEESTRRLALAAAELFGEQGFEATTTSQLGERAGYSREMVRKRYGSKEGLLNHLLERELAQRISPAPDPALSGLHQVLGQVDSLLALMEDDEALARAFFVLCFETAGPAPRLRPWFHNWFAGIEAQTADSLRAGQLDGSVSAHVDPAAEAKAFILFSVGHAFRKVLDWDGYDFIGELQAWRAKLQAAYGRAP